MKKDVVNLYVSALGCPKCNIIKNMCEESNYIKNNTDFRIISIDPSDLEDTDLCLLAEQGFEEFPVMLVNDDFYDFSKSVLFLRRRDEDEC